MRQRKPFKRTEGKRSDVLFVIATEGKDTERIYFEEIKKNLQTARIHLEILPSINNASAPNQVLTRLNDFLKDYDTDNDDQFWIVIDKDKWTDKMLSYVAQTCKQKKNYFMGLSNPCFELWLLLHIEDISNYSPEDMSLLSNNKKNKANGDPWLKCKMRQLMGSYSESSYNANVLIKNINDAIDRAKALDKNKHQRWPQSVGTRVYRLAQNILNKAD